MTVRRQITSPYLLCLLVFISLLAWPAFVLSSSVLSYIVADAWQLQAWAQVPKRALLQHFLDGYQHSALLAVSAGIVTVLDYLLMSRLQVTWWFSGIGLPLVGFALATIFLPSISGAIPVLLATGLLLAVSYRLFDLLASRFSGGMH